MLDYGGDPSTLTQCSDPSIQRALQVYHAVRTKKNTGNLPILCPCGHDVPIELCHGIEEGVPLHDRQHCFCRSGKKYAKCCKKRRYYYRESIEKEIPPSIYITDRGTLDAMLEQIRQPDFIKQYDGDKPIFTSMEIKVMAKFMQDTCYSTANDMIKSGDTRIDHCFQWILKHPKNDFYYARLWRKPGSASSDFPIDKVELTLRSNQWNSWVDEYISKKDSFYWMKKRSDVEIAQLNKVSWRGTALFRPCGNRSHSGGGCKKQQEETLNDFKMCSKCMITAYCSQVCRLFTSHSYK